MTQTSGYVHLIGELVDSRSLVGLGPATKWQMTLCNRVACTDSLLTDNPRKVTCPACIKRLTPKE